jgi:hypothetical protein
MNRAFAFIGAVLLASITVSSACLAASDDGLHFTLEPEHGNGGKIHANFRESRRSNNETSWSSGFMPSELIGLDTSGFRSSGTRPLRFAIVREAGRLDCGGNGGGNYANGYCRFTPDPAFTQLLVSRGIARPTPGQGLSLMALNVRRELIDGIAAAGYPTPTIEDLTSLTALGVDGRYIREMGRAGYRPRSLQTMVEFKALGITPEWIGGFVRIGHANYPQDGLVQLKAMGITPDFVAGFDRIGYRDLPVDTLVQLKAMGIAPEFIAGFDRIGYHNLSADTLVQLKALGITPEFVRTAVGQRATLPPVHELVDIKLFGPNGRP